MNSNIISKLRDLLLKTSISEEIIDFLLVIIIIVVILFLAYLADLVAKNILLSVIKRLVKRSKTSWDDTLYQKRVFNRLAHIAPALVIYYFIGFTFSDYEKLSMLLKTLINIYIIFVSVRVINAFVNGLNEIYETLPISKNKPIKSYVQVFIILIYIISILLVLSLVLNREIGNLLTGLGAMAAILLLVFKDTILGLVGGIQLSANDMIRPGDWIEMPSRKADGDVIEITLNTVKVQNFDKTITTIPTYALVTESFINWRGMQDSGFRRIKRSINIDMQSIRFLDQELIDKFKKYELIRSYVEEREKEIKEFNNNQKIDDTVPVNGRRMTNLGTFRKYMEAYLRNHPKITDKATFLVRHLQPTEKGLPIEIYVFANDNRWVNYEGIQADIFDHLLAVISEFELRVFQNPSGADFQKIINQ